MSVFRKEAILPARTTTLRVLVRYTYLGVLHKSIRPRQMFSGDRTQIFYNIPEYNNNNNRPREYFIDPIDQETSIDPRFFSLQQQQPQP